MPITVGVHQRAASIQTKTLNEANRTIDVVFATDAPVRTYDWSRGEVFNEVLGFGDGMIDFTRMDAGAPVLDNHDRYSGTEGVRGVVEKAWTEKNKGIATIRFATDEASERMYQKVKDGILRTISVGYMPHEYEDITPESDRGKKGKLRTLKATKWEPMEVSFAPIPADPASAVRKEKEEGREVIIVNESIQQRDLFNQTQKNTTMTPEEIELKRKADEAAELQRKAIETATLTGLKQAAEIVAEVNKHRSAFGKTEDADKYITEVLAKPETTLDSVRAHILDLKKDGQPPIGGLRRATVNAGGHEGEQGRAAAMLDGVVARMAPHVFKEEAKRSEGSEYRHKTLLRMAEDFLEEKGIDTTKMDQRSVARMAMSWGIQNRDFGMSASDFPSLFLNVLNKVLRRDYQFETGKWKPITYRQDTNQINRNSPSIKMGDFGALQRVLEGAEFKRQSVVDGAENFQVNKYGNSFAITIEMIINDDLGGIMKMIDSAARTNSFTEDLIVFNLLASNPNMSDGNPVFSSAHNNVGPTGSVSLAVLSGMRKLFRAQLGTNGEPLDLEPTYILTGLANEDAVNNILNITTVPVTAADVSQSNIKVSPPYIRALKPIISARIPGNAIYMSADPNMIDTIRTGSLTGQPEFSIEEHYEYKNQSWEYQITKFFGAAYTDYRGLVYAAGQ